MSVGRVALLGGTGFVGRALARRLARFSMRMRGLMHRSPVLPVIGAGTRVQPVHVDDLADALQCLLRASRDVGPVIQAVGPHVCTMIELLRVLRDRSGARCCLLPLPQPVALGLAAVAERLPASPLCRDQVRLMRTDKIAEAGLEDLSAVGIAPDDPLTEPAEQR